MFPTFIGILDIQSWWEVPSIAHFCSLFRAAFNLLDFDIEDLEEALLTDGGTEGHLVQELIVRLLEGCLPNDTRNDISTFNYQMFLRRLFRKKCQEYKCENPFNTDVDFELLPLRQKVEILRALCDFRLDAEDVEQSLSNLDSDSLRVEPLGHDRKNSAYWYFYGTRLYREDYIDTADSSSSKQKSKSRDRKHKRRRNRVAKKEEEEEEKEEEDSLIYGETKKRQSVWQVVCFTQQDWSRLVEKFRDSEYDTERKLYRTLSEDFMPEIPKLFDLKEKQQRRKLLQRSSSRILQNHEPIPMETVMVRSKIKTKTSKTTKKGTQSSKTVYIKEKTPPPVIPPIPKKGRQTNNSLASAVGQIVIQTRDEVEDLEKKRGSHGDRNYMSSNYGYKYGYPFGIEEEERRVGMHKVLECLKDHVDAWPFLDPVDEEYAPRYYSVVRKPMDLSTMEEKLEGGSYKTLSQFKRDFRLIIDNCRQYNGSDNEYTEMAMNLKEAFEKAVNRYLESETSSDDDSVSPKSVSAVPTSPSSLSYNASSYHNVRKRSKKSAKKSKSGKTEGKIKVKSNERNDDGDKRNKNHKMVKKKKDKRKSKKTKDIESVDEDEDEQEQESEDAVSESDVVTSKRRKHSDTNNLFLKTKKLSSKELEPVKKSNKKLEKEQPQQKKEAEILRSAKDTKENKRRKEDFEEDYEPLVIAKSKSRKIEKKEFEDSGILTDNPKRQSKLEKIDSQEDDTLFEKDEKDVSHIKIKRNRKKEKTEVKSVIKAENKAENHRTKEKEKKSKQKGDEFKNGELKNQGDSKTELDTKTTTSKKFSGSIGDEDIESLDSLKDKISERRREEKMKHEREKHKKIVKNDVHSMYSKKVPSNGSTFHDNDRINVKRPKSKKGTKEEKCSVPEDTVKPERQDTIENKKVKSCHSKHTKGFGKEESSAIQALNQATEQTLHDINKWLDDAPKLSEFSSGSDSPVLHPSVEPGRPGPKGEVPRKRPSSIKIFGPHGPSRPKKIQRTIDRLQPGKSKGNLLLKKPLNLPNTNANDTTAYQSASDNDQPSKDADEEPKLSLGTVLKNVDSIQLICKSLVSSPNPNLSNDEDEEDRTALPLISISSAKEEKVTGKGTTSTSTTVEESKENRLGVEETQKPKSATPNLSAWFKAFGAPKSKKKEEEVEESATKKDGELQEVFCGRQRRMSTGGSSISESVSSFSQESPPGRSIRSPQSQPVITSTESQIRGAGFYQDALSTGSSPYNSPYYTTPPRYSAQLPPTPSPQNHPLSPAYPSSASYEQTSIYPQISSQPSHQTYQKSPQENPVEAYRQLSPTFSQRSPQSEFPQNSAQSEPYVQQLASGNQNQSPVYPQHSPQAGQPVYPQPSPQTPPSNYSQPSPQQPPTPKYSPSPQQNAVANYSQPSPQAVPNYSQPSPQQQHSPYSQASPQTPPSYSHSSPQQQHSPYAQSSPQPASGYSQMSPQLANYSQPSTQPPAVYPQRSPHPPGFTQPSPQAHPAHGYSPSPQPPPAAYSPSSPQPRNYSQSSPQQIPTYSQHSPQTPAGYSQPSPQNASYSQPSPQPMGNFSQSSPQQPANYSHPLHSPQTPSNYSQLSPQQTSATNYSQPSPQPSRNYSQPSPQQKICNTSQSSQSNYSQPSPQPAASYAQSQPAKNSEEYQQNVISSPHYSQSYKQNHSPYVQPSTTPSLSDTEHQAEYLKSSSKEKSSTTEQQRNFETPSETPASSATNQAYQSSSQYPSTYGNAFANVDVQRSKHSNQEQQQQQQQQSLAQERPFTDLGESLTAQKYAQQRSFVGKPSNAAEQLPPQDQSQILAFQQNIAAHESLYPATFQPSGYPMPNSRPVYPSPHYFETTTKPSTTTSTTSSSNPPPVKKRIYSEPPSDPPRSLPQETVSRTNQEQFGFDPMVPLPQPDAVSASQFDSAFVSSLADSVANPAYARLGLGLVGRAGKEQQQLLTIPRPPTKPEHLPYARSPAPGTAELDLNLLQSLQTAAKNTQGLLSMSRRVTEPAAPKTKKSRKSKQQEQQQTSSSSSAASSTEQQPSIPGFPQYTGTSADSISLKTSSVVPAGSAFNFAAPTSTTSSSPFYDKDATAAAAAFAFLDEFRNPNSYYSMALRQQQQQQQQPVTAVSDAAQSACNKLTNQPPRSYPPHPFLHSAQRATAYGPPVSAYVTPHGPNLAVDPAAYQQYIHSLYALQPPPPHHHRPSWL